MAVPTLAEVKDSQGIDFDSRDNALEDRIDELERWFRDRSTLEAGDEFPDELKPAFLIAFKAYWEDNAFPTNAMTALGTYYQVSFGGEDEVASSTTSTTTRQADTITVDTSGFSGNLGSMDDDVQTALGTIDALATGSLGSATPEAIGTAAAGTSGQAARSDHVHGADYTDIANTPTLSTVATSGDYDDLTNKPTIRNIPDPTGATDGQVATIDSGAWTIADATGGTDTNYYVDSVNWSSSANELTFEFNAVQSDITVDLSSLDVDTDTTYTAGNGLTLSTTEFSVDYPLPDPTSATDGQVAKIDGGAWVIGDDETTTGGTGDGVVNSAAFSGTGTITLTLGRSNSLNNLTADLDLVAGNIPNLGTAKITSGTFTTARIPNLNANKITTGSLDADRLPTGTIVLDPSSATDGQVAKVSSGAWVIGDDEQGSGSGSTDLSLGTRTATTMVVESSSGTNVTLPEADATNAGLLGSADHDTIAGIATTYAALAGAAFTGEVTITQSTANPSIEITHTGAEDALIINQSQAHNAIQINQTGGAQALMLIQSGNHSAMQIQAAETTSSPAFNLITNTSGDRKAFQATMSGSNRAWASFEYSAGGSGKPGIALGTGLTGEGRDTNIYRDGTNLLATSDAFEPGQFTSTNRDALSGMRAGAIIWNTTTTQLEVYNGTAWAAV